MGPPRAKSYKVKKRAQRSTVLSRETKGREEARKALAAALEEEQEMPEEAPHLDLLTYVHDESESVKDQLENLKTRFRMLRCEMNRLIREKDFTKEVFIEWHHAHPGEWTRHFESVFLKTQSWAGTWASYDLDVVLNLSKKQKQQLIVSLDGYCVQEDLDKLVSRFDSFTRKGVPNLFVQMFLNKTVIDKFFRHPFWYVNPDVDGKNPGEDLPWQGVLPCGALLETLYSNFEGVGSEYAQIWRSVTSRLCNSALEMQARNTSFGKAMKAHRDARARSLASELLENDILRCLLKPTDDVEQRKRNLARHLEFAAQTAVDIFCHNPALRFRTLHDLDPQFHHPSNTMDTTYASLKYCPKEVDDLVFDGCTVLCITNPFVFRVENEAEEDEEVPVVRAMVTLEEKPSADEEAPGKGKAKKADKKNS